MRDKASSEKTATLSITTPEGVTFSLLLAGPVTRFLAWLIDFFTVFLLTSTVNYIVNVLSIFSHDFARAFSLISYFVISIGYGIAFEWYWNGRTVGKHLLRLRVMDVQGLQLKPTQIIIRNLLRFVDALPVFYLVGGVSCFFSEKAQRFGDMAANTIVVRNTPISIPDFTNLFADKYNSFRDYPHLEAKLRQNVSNMDAEIALQALFRREDLEPDARINLFREIASYFIAVLEFPQKATDGLSDEQYTRNVVDTLYRSSYKII
jgi:uncharacterized RDD family membrane protein YckC